MTSREIEVPTEGDTAGERHSAPPPLPMDPDLNASPDADRADAHGPRSAPDRSRVLAAITAGGFAGGLARYGLGLAAPTPHGGFPATTFAVNVSGSFLLAVLLVFIIDIWPPTRYARPLLCVGFCGAYTTFSTWMVDTDRLVSAHDYATAAWNLGGSLLAGLAATSLGLTAGRAVLSHRNSRSRDREAAEPTEPAEASA